MSIWSRLRMRAPAARTFVVQAGIASGEWMPLSLYDLLTGHVFIQQTFFFAKSLDGEALRQSLSRTLRRFPILAGRITFDRDGYQGVLCSDAGARFVEVDDPRPMPRYSHTQPATRELNAYAPATNPLWVAGRDTPLLYVKLTQFSAQHGGGSALGIAIDHSLMDAWSTVQFFYSWSCEHRGVSVPQPFHDRRQLDALGERASTAETVHSRVFLTGSIVDKLRFYGRLIAGAHKLECGIFRISAAEVRALKARASLQATAVGSWVSENDAVTAHLFKVLGELRGRPEESPEELGLIADVRPRLKGILPEQYCGNGATSSVYAIPAGKLRASSLGEIALGIRATQEENTPAAIYANLGYLERQRKAHLSNRVLPKMMLGVFDQAITLNNWSKLSMYECDWGSGPPFWYQMLVGFIPWLTMIMPTPLRDGSRDVTVVAPREAIRRLREPEWQQRLHRYAEG